ncbi:MAG: DUF3572 domain-containing protein [Cohaesibacter sp.]|jgi:hypothetical protein|nr:DUF3572 domain-containing protein [Cohaesibacter sp.]
MHPHHSRLSKDHAEDIAIKALTFLSQDTEMLGRFLALSGLDPVSLRDVIGEPSFLAAVLDYMMQDDATLLAFTANNGLAPEDILKAKQKLDPMASASTGAL